MAMSDKAWQGSCLRNQPLSVSGEQDVHSERQAREAGSGQLGYSELGSGKVHANTYVLG